MIRILQVVGGLDRAGVETWLMHVLRNIDRDRFRMDFLVHGQETYAYEDEAKQLGARVIRCLHPDRPWVYFRNFRRILQAYGPYDVVHGHVHHFSGIAMLLAHRAKVPIRIAHSHVDTRTVDANRALVRGEYLGIMSWWIKRHATLGLCASDMARKSLFPQGVKFSFPIHTVPYSLDLKPFSQSIDRQQVRRELNIPSDAVVVGHVGRFEHQKNQMFVAEVARELHDTEPKAWFLMVGDGELRESVMRRFDALGVSRRASFTGVSNSVPRLMKGAMDLFLFPSLYEGLGLAFVEAQAAGLACLVSSCLPEEGDVIRALVRRLPLDENPAVWAQTLSSMHREPRSISSRAALNLVKQSRFGAAQSVMALECFYTLR